MLRIARAFLIVTGLLAAATSAYGQAILNSGAVTPGHAPMYVQGGVGSQVVATDSGPAGGGGIGLGLAEMLLTVRGTGTAPYANAGTGPLGTNACDYDAPITNATGYHYLCWSPNAQGGGLLAYGAGGSASQLPFNLNVNGTVYTFGGSTGTTFATVAVPTPNGDVVCFSGTAGLLFPCPAGAATIQGNPSSTSGNPSAFTIQGLTAKPSPDPSLDYLLLYDHSAGTFAKVTPSQIVGAVSIANSNLAPMGAASLKGNPAATTQQPSDLTIQGLTQKTPPDANLDYVMLYDHVSGTLMKVTPGQIASAATAGVSSFGSQTGAILVGSGLSMSGTTLNATGVSSVNGVTGTPSVTAGTGISVNVGGSNISVALASIDAGGATGVTNGSSNCILYENSSSNVACSATPVRHVRVVAGAASVAIFATDDIVVINNSTGSGVTVTLPSSPSSGQTVTIKDGSGTAATANLTFTPATGTIDGSSTLVVGLAYASVTLVYNGSQWNAI